MPKGRVDIDHTRSSTDRVASGRDAIVAAMAGQRLIRQLLDASRITLWLGLVVACAVAFVAYRATGNPDIAYWLATLSSITLVRVTAIPWMKHHLGPAEFTTVGRLYTLGALAAGITWGMLVWFDSVDNPMSARLLLLIILVGMPVASLSSNAIHRPVFFAFSVPIFAALLIWAWWLSPDFAIEFTVVALAHAVLTTTIANRYHASLALSVEREIENQRLLHEVNLMNSELQRMAYEDPLTGLSNRRRFQETAQDLLARRRKDEALALMLIDMDNFKEINDSLGHAAGDQVLVTLSQRIDANSRISELVAHAPTNAARIGGDEFILLYRLEPGAEIEALAARILAASTRPMRLENRDLTPSVSIGIAVAPQQADTVDGLLRLADAAMYDAKSRGGGCFVFADPRRHRDSAAPATDSQA